jgi:hypothetical protein
MADELEINQADRIAAVECARDNLTWTAFYRTAVLQGQKDHNYLVQAFAKHRLSASQPAAEPSEEMIELTLASIKAVAAGVVQSACETDPADPDHPDTILITTGDLETIVRARLENEPLYTRPTSTPTDAVEGLVRALEFIVGVHR